jgi:flagellar biosynthesis protein FliR
MEHYATAQQVWAAGLVFFRVGALVMLMPGVGETFVPARIRLSFALLVAICIGPLAAPNLPPMPAGVGDMAGFVIRETLIGLMIGGLARMFLASLLTAGEVISLQTTLAFAQTANPTQAQPAATISTFLTIMGLTLIFDTDLHRMFISAIVHSYTLFPPMKGLPLGDAATLATQTVAKTFVLGIQLAAPVIVFALVFNIASGLIGRVMPQFQIFFVATPLSLLFGLSVFALSLGGITLTWVQGYESFLHIFA